MRPQTIIIDNYDSFTYNLVHLYKDVTGEEVDVFRNDEISLNEVSRYNNIVLSPGPGVPSQAGIMPEIVRKFFAEKKILGVCLGHQCIGEVFGATLYNMPEVCHGLGIATNILDSADPLFHSIENGFISGRYHSWVVDMQSLPSALIPTASDEAGRLMAFRHREYRVWGVQFHPESVLTLRGATILKNWGNC
jgi:anthranilate synthase component 2